MAEPNVAISILVVDDDATCLSLVAGYLQKRHHNVIATKNPKDALCMLKLTSQSFHLILTDVHMPEMSGLDILNYSVEEDLKVPLILMSTDADEGIMQQGLNDGATHYFLKPTILEALERVWQFALPKSPSRSLSPPLIREPRFGNQWLNPDYCNNNNVINANNDSRSLSKNNANAIGTGNVAPRGRRKAKLIWTPYLHNQFLEAVNELGQDRAVPKKILEYMNVPGLKRENVASHLQKYRIFLKRISETSKEGAPGNWHEKPIRSSFLINEISVLTNNLQQQYQQLLEQSQGQGQITSTQATSIVATVPEQEVVINIVSSGGEQAAQIASENAMNTDETTPLVEGNNVQDTITINISTNEDVIMQNPNQPAPNHYIGFRLNSNGELLGPFNDEPIRPEGNTSNTDGINCDANQKMNDHTVIGDSAAYSSLNEVPPNMLGHENQQSADIPSLVDNATHQEPGFRLSNEIPSSSHANQEIFGGESSFGAFDMQFQGSDLGTFEGFDQDAFDLSNDFLVDYNYIEDYEQKFWDFTQDGSFDISELD